MQQLLTMIHVLIALAIIGLVLIQHGKGADMGAGFGSGSSQTMFGSAGSTPFLVKVTGMLAAAFFVNCLLLTYVVATDVKKPDSVDLMSTHTSTTSVPVPQKSNNTSTVPVKQTPKTPKD